MDALNDHSDSQELTPESALETASVPIRELNLGAAESVKKLLQLGEITDEKERRAFADAADFLQSLPPYQTAEVAKRHMVKVAEYLAYMEMEGRSPPEINQLYVRLCTVRIRFSLDYVRKELGYSAPFFSVAQAALDAARDDANNLAKGYNDGTLLREVEALQEEMDRRNPAAGEGDSTPASR